MRTCTIPKRIRTLTAVRAASAVLVLFSASVLAQDRAAPKTLPPDGSCTAAECHGDLAARTKLHPPVKKPGCGVCHESQGNQHKFALAFKGPELCYACHESVTKKKHVHAPLEGDEAACTICHDPHGGSTESFLRASSVNALCVRCHQQIKEDQLYHRPENVKGCTACHVPHSSDSAKLLNAEPPQLCYFCHKEMKAAVDSAASVHGPMAAGCDVCHDPHLVRAGDGLKEVGPGLCTTCHADFKDTLTAMSARHAPLMQGAACGQCHDAHAGRQKHLLKDTPQALCLNCHEKPVQEAGGESLSGLADLRQEGEHLHGALAGQQCGACHEPHGNGGFRFLREAYPAQFYSPYSDDAYALCFSCHDASLVDDRLTTSATGFRNGDENLHYVHVHKTPKGRTCRACHAPHAGKNPQLIRDSVPFGSWQIPIRFEQTANGGKCSTGCHLPKSYERASPAHQQAAPARAPGEEGSAPSAKSQPH